MEARDGVPYYAPGQSCVIGNWGTNIFDRSTPTRNVPSTLLVSPTHASLAGFSLFALRESALDRLRRIVSVGTGLHVPQTSCISAYHSAQPRIRYHNSFDCSSVAAVNHIHVLRRERADSAIALVALLSLLICSSRRHTLPCFQHGGMQCGS